MNRVIAIVLLIVTVVYARCGSEDLLSSRVAASEPREESGQPKCAEVAAARQLLAAALKDAPLARPASARAEAYLQIAKVQAKIGDAEGARRTFEEAKTVASQIGSAADKVEFARRVAAVMKHGGDTSIFAGMFKEENKPDFYIKIAKAQAEIGGVAEAVRTLVEARTAASLLANDVIKGHWCAQTAVAQSTIGDIEGAQVTAARITGENDREAAYAGIALAQAKAGDSKGANRSIELGRPAWKLRDWRFIAYDHVHIADAQVQGGHMAEARQSLAKALVAASQIGNEGGDVYAFIAAAQLRAGDIAGAKATAAQISWKPAKDSSYRGIATAQARAGNLAEAKATLAQVSGPRCRADAYQELAKAQSQAGDAAGAHQSRQEAINAASQIDEPSFKKDAFCKIARAQMNARDAAGARQTLRHAKAAAPQINNKDDRSNAYCEIAKLQAEAGDMTEATATVAQITNEFQKAEARNSIAAAQVKIGDVAAARATAAQSSSDEFKAWAYSTIAAAQAEAGDVAGALATAAQVAHAGAKVSAYRKIAEQQVKGGDIAGVRKSLAEARTVVSQINDEYKRSAEYRGIAEEQAATGDAAEAKATAAQIRDKETKFVGNCTIAEAQARAGDVPGAIEWLKNTSDDPAFRSYWLAEAAERLCPPKPATPKTGGEAQ